jgi:ATP-independent RNA helicase DbpA
MLPKNMTLVIEGGKKNKIRPGDILGALTKDAKIEGSKIGKIDVFDRQSYVAIDKEYIKKAYNELSRGKIKGKTFSIWILE